MSDVASAHSVTWRPARSPDCDPLRIGIDGCEASIFPSQLVCWTSKSSGWAAVAEKLVRVRLDVVWRMSSRVERHVRLSHLALGFPFAALLW